jgi:predicted amidophosphoribosyltransferase
VVALKFRAALPAAAVMAAQIAARAPRALLAGAAIVPVPAAPARRRRRGFDPAERLAAELARRTGRPVAPCLRRGGTAGRQLGARRAERLGRRRLAVTADGDAPATALLVDDVHTTGATLDACARALRAAGSRDVRAIAYARTLRGA